MKVYLVGVGLGNRDTLTLEGQRAIEEAQLLIGAPRLLEGYENRKCLPLIKGEDIARAIREADCPCVAVLFSGDIGFYSGAKQLYPLLEDVEVVPVPGVSSLVYLCAKCRTPWQDVFLVSAHGRSHNAPGAIQSHARTFCLTGSTYTAGDLLRDLVSWGMGEVQVTVGERLSYPQESITRGTAQQLAGREFDSLAVVLAENPHPIHRAYQAPALPDSAFLRGKVPMTKEEVRMVSLCKLRLQPHHVVWDVGAGTGSVSVECALAAHQGQVYAIEGKEEALALIKQNRKVLGLTNLHIVPGLAPQALEELPPPDRVFLGGTGGRMEEIMALALARNPQVRFVVNAVTLETLAEGVRCFQALNLEDVDMVQLSATRTRLAGRYHLMDAQNPVWVMSGEGRHG